MKITLITIGKTDDAYILEGIDKYLKRLKHYIKFEIQIIPDLKKTKNLSEEEQKNKEAELFLKNITMKTKMFIFLETERKKWN